MRPVIDLRGKRGLVVGIANESSIAAGCAEAFSQAGASLAASYVNEKAKPFTEAVTDRLKMDWTAPCDVRVPGELEALFDRVKSEWGGPALDRLRAEGRPLRPCRRLLPPRGSLWRWTSPAIRSFEWPSLPSP